ncbi:MAG: hypothetical protein ACYCVB_07565 [Bacilli bacterium]
MLDHNAAVGDDQAGIGAIDRSRIKGGLTVVGECRRMAADRWRFNYEYTAYDNDSTDMFVERSRRSS